RAGGFDQYADSSSVKIIRQDPKDPQKQRTIRVNIDAVIKKGQRDRDVDVLPGDVIVVPEKFFNF
ncbi:MAG: hypothetical protein K2X81_28610, partial [Candidatus Obscuribacterales bacterium]|nr:hypothetical protein [Candidatus Obscuribacterales bacterium]